MKRLFVPVLAMVACTATEASTPPAPPPTTTPPHLDARFAQLDSFLADQLAQHHIPGMVAAVITRDGIAWSKSYGVRDLTSHAPVTTDTMFRIGSVTKVITALAVLELRDAGKLDLDAPVSTWIAELATVVAPTKDSPPITLRHLMTHMSGLPREPQLHDPYGAEHEITEQELLASLHDTKLESSPGTTWSYSNLGAALEGLVVARASKQPYAAYVQEHLLRPLGMTTATFDRSKIPAASRASSYLEDGAGIPTKPAPELREGATAARGQLYASIQDMARFAMFELQAWPPRDEIDRGPVRRSTVRESQRTEGPSAPGPESKGAGWFLEATPMGTIISHGGAGEGFMSEIWISTVNNVAFVVMINDDDPATTTIALHARDILLPRLETPLELVAKLLNDTSDSNAAQLVDPVYLKGLQSRGSLRTFARVRAATGPCVVAPGQTDAIHGTITCGSKAWQVTVGTSATHQIDQLLIVPK